MAANPPIIPSSVALPAAASRSTINVDTAGQVPIERYNVSDTIYDKNVLARPYTVVLESIGGVQRWDDTHRWYEDEPVPQRDALDGSLAAGSTTIVVANGAKFTVGDNIYIHSYRAQGHVTVKVGNTLTVVWVAAPTAAVPTGTVCTRIGNSQEQIATPTPGPTTKEVQYSNYFQSMWHEVAASIMHVHGNFRTNPADWPRQQKKKLQEHLTEKEKTLIFGQRALWAAGVTGGSPMGHSQGLYYFLTTNVRNVGGVLTRAIFDAWLAGIMRANTHPNQDWWLLCSTRVGMQISQFGQPFERTTSEQEMFGVRVTVYRAPVHKDVKIVIHPLFDREGMDDLGILLNVGEDCMKYVYHSVLNTRKYTAIQPYGRSAMEIFFWTVFTCEVKGEEINGGIIEGVAAST